MLGFVFFGLCDRMLDIYIHIYIYIYIYPWQFVWVKVVIVYFVLEGEDIKGGATSRGHGYKGCM